MRGRRLRMPRASRPAHRDRRAAWCSTALRAWATGRSRESTRAARADRPSRNSRSPCGATNTIRRVSAPPAFATLQTKLGEIVDLVKTSALLSWDQQTQMPSLGSEARAQQLGTVGRLAHEAFVSDEVGTLLEELRPYGESLDHDSFEASLIRVVQRDYDKSVRVPPELSAETARASSRAFGVWVEARTRSDYELFRPGLEGMVGLIHRYVDCLRPAEDPYDTL